MTTETSLYQHLLLERGPVRFDQLVSTDIPGMAHCLDFPKDEPQLRRELRALADAKPPLARTWMEGKVEWWQALPVQEPVDPQGALPGFDYWA